MYETLMMIKPGEEFSMKAMADLVTKVCQSGEAEVKQTGGGIRVSLQEASLMIHYADGDWVAIESEELAARFNLPVSGCLTRFEMTGRDDDMLLYNEYLLINERLEDTGLFVVFDQFSGKRFGT
jgi:hypothetical protein